jgi:phosphotransferase system  glucose/maltose/N-acetylglucosamine-specific IIC component
MNYFIATFLARFVGILLLIPAIFPAWFINWFPGLEDRRASWVLFVIGIIVYAGASIVYRIFYKKEQARRRTEMEDI